MRASIKKRFDILGVGDSFRIWHFDGNGAIEIIVMGKIDRAKPALT